MFIFILVFSIGIVFAMPVQMPVTNPVPVPVPVPAPVSVPVPDAPSPSSGGVNNGENIQPLPQLCQNPNDTACFFQVNDPRKNGAINTKIQSEPYETYYWLRCSRVQNKLDLLYTLAENQTSNECKNAIDFTDLS